MNPIFSNFCRLAISALFLGSIVGCSAAQSPIEGWVEAKDIPTTVSSEAESPLSFTSSQSSHRSRVRTRSKDVIAPGFEVAVSILEDSNFNGRYRVDFDGALHLPYDVTVQAKDKSERELEQDIQSAVAYLFRSPPSVTVRVSDRAYSIDVQGLVQKPGRYLVHRESSLDELIGKAGGLQSARDGQGLPQYVRIESLGKSAALKLSDYYSGRIDGAREWMGGDVVFFQSDPVQGPGGGALTTETAIQVLGEVREPGEYHFANGENFLYYLAKAGGPTENADLARIEVIRSFGNRRLSKQIDLNRVTTFPDIEDGDLVLIHSKDQNLVIPNVTSVINSLATVVLAAFAI